MSRNPYLLANRLEDVIFLIQHLGLGKSYSLEATNKSVHPPRRGGSWATLARDHREFFRVTENDSVVLSLRYYQKPDDKQKEPEDDEQKEPEDDEQKEPEDDEQKEPEDDKQKKPEGKKRSNRPPLPPDVVRELVQIAVALHEQQAKRADVWKIWGTFIAAMVAAVSGIAQLYMSRM